MQLDLEYVVTLLFAYEKLQVDGVADANEDIVGQVKKFVMDTRAGSSFIGNNDIPDGLAIQDLPRNVPSAIGATKKGLVSLISFEFRSGLDLCERRSG